MLCRLPRAFRDACEPMSIPKAPREYIEPALPRKDVSPRSGERVNPELLRAVGAGGGYGGGMRSKSKDSRTSQESKHSKASARRSYFSDCKSLRSENVLGSGPHIDSFHHIAASVFGRCELCS